MKPKSKKQELIDDIRDTRRSGGKVAEAGDVSSSQRSDSDEGDDISDTEFERTQAKLDDDFIVDDEEW